MIEIINVSKYFGEFKALNNVNLKMASGSIFGLVGSNGAGKSTLLRILAGVYQTDEGFVKIDDQPVFENIDIKQRLLFISDYPYFTPSDTVYKLANTYRKLYPKFNETAFNNYLNIFKINPKQKITTMSKGMQRQVALILGLSTTPKYILFDEIFDGLDPVVRELVKKILISFVSENDATVVIASHNLRELEDVCDHIGLIHQGGALFDDEVDNLKLGLMRVQFVLSNQEDITAIESQLNIIKKSQQSKMIELTVRGTQNAVLEVINSFNPIYVESLPLTLEELFISEMEAVGYDTQNLTK